jgi:hypothetical protein
MNRAKDANPNEFFVLAASSLVGEQTSSIVELRLAERLYETL